MREAVSWSGDAPKHPNLPPLQGEGNQRSGWRGVTASDQRPRLPGHPSVRPAACQPPCRGGIGATPLHLFITNPYEGPMHSRFESLPNRRTIVDRRALAEQVAALGITGPQGRTLVTPVLRAALDAGRQEVARRLAIHPSRGLEAAAAQAYLTDQILRVLFDFTTDTLLSLIHI